MDSLRGPWRRCWQLFHTHFGPFSLVWLGNFATSKLMRLTSRGRISKFDPPLNAPGSVLLGALWINVLRCVWRPLSHFFWKWEQNVTSKRRSMDCTPSLRKVFANSQNSAAKSNVTWMYPLKGKGFERFKCLPSLLPIARHSLWHLKLKTNGEFWLLISNVRRRNLCWFWA